jgi:ferric-dicitrate binding protein FerR (iron transport regulator)
MTDRSKEHMDEESIARLIRDLPVAEPDPAFRERLRHAFASGEIDPAPARKADRVTRSAGWRWWRWAVPVFAAIVVMLAVNPLNHGSDLRVMETAGTGDVHIDGQRVALDDSDALNAAIHPGIEIEVPSGATVDLVVKDVVLYELAGGTRMTIPETPGRWFGNAVACSLFVGELRLKTGEDFAGSQLRVFTPEGIVEVTGTLLSVQCDAGGTCVCVLEGVAQVGVDDGDLEPVEPGYRKIMLRDGTVDIIPVKPMHRDGVLDFDRRIGHKIGE